MSRPRVIEPTGKRFGKWTVVGLDASSARHRYVCTCDCGVEAVVVAAHLRQGKSTACMSCGHQTHGRSYSDVYSIWHTMIARCRSVGFPRYADYGARGVTVTDEWVGPGGFERFAAHIGPRPSPTHSVDRIENDRGYEPGNVRWATPVEQATNRRSTRFLEIGAERLSISEWSRRAGVNSQTICERLKRGWSHRDAVMGRRAS